MAHKVPFWLNNPQGSILVEWLIRFHSCFKRTLIASFMWPTWGPTWALPAPGGSHVGPMNLAIWGPIKYNSGCIMANVGLVQLYDTLWHVYWNSWVWRKRMAQAYYSIISKLLLYLLASARARSQYRLSFPGMGLPMLKIRLSRDCLFFNMGIPILVRWHHCIETAPRFMAY